MTQEIKEAYNFAQKEIEKEKQEALKQKVKEIVKATLEKIDEIDKKEKELAEQKKILKKDIDDLKSGRLDLIEERQKESEVARKTSVFRIVLKEIQYPPLNSVFTIYPSSTTTTFTNQEWIGTGWMTASYTGGTYQINSQVKYL